MDEIENSLDKIIAENSQNMHKGKVDVDFIKNHIHNPFTELIKLKGENKNQFSTEEENIESSIPFLRLKGIYRDYDQNIILAVINNKIVAKGDMIENCEIIDISENSV